MAASRREPLAIAAINPEDGTKYDVLIAYERMMAVGRRSLGHANECAHIVPETLQNPTAIFEGLTLEEDEDRRGYGWRCYCSVPTRAFRSDGKERNAYPNQVYLVFVNDEMVAYNWRWENADADDPRLPMNHATRFRRRLL